MLSGEFIERKLKTRWKCLYWDAPHLTRPIQILEMLIHRADVGEEEGCIL